MGPARYIPPLFKILILGESGVGKSCLLNRFSDDTFCERYVATIGVDFKTKTVEIEGRDINLELWDSAGQERFRTITAQGSHGVILCFDISNRESYERIEDWMKEIEDQTDSNLSFVLCGLKVDLHRAVRTSEARRFADKYNMKYVEASPRTNFGVAAPFMLVAAEILQNYFLTLESFHRHTTIIHQPELSTPCKKCSC